MQRFKLIFKDADFNKVKKEVVQFFKYEGIEYQNELEGHLTLVTEEYKFFPRSFQFIMVVLNRKENDVNLEIIFGGGMTLFLSSVFTSKVTIINKFLKEIKRFASRENYQLVEQ